MKFRTDFVTNSSSSSFVCELCNEAAGGYDLSISDTDFIECQHGHCFCIGHLSQEEFINFLEIQSSDVYNNEGFTNEHLQRMQNILFRYTGQDGFIDIYEAVVALSEEDLLDRYNWPTACCPICQNRLIPDYKILDFLLQLTRLTKDDAIEKFKQKEKVFVEEEEEEII